MAFLKKFFKKKSDATPERVLVASIREGWLSEMYQDILKENGIPCICYNHGPGGYFKIIAGSTATPDSIYVNVENAEKAKELYDNYIVNCQAEIIPDSEDEN